MKYTPEEIKIANRTSRSGGAIGKKAIVPAYVLANYDKDLVILDFGAGKDAAHAKMLREEGFSKVIAAEFGKNQNRAVHDPQAVDYKYDLVYASNVLNVQSSVNMLGTTLETLANCVRIKGELLVNYPLSPRKGVMDSVDSEQLETFLGSFFIEVNRVGGTRTAPLLRCSGVIR